MTTPQPAADTMGDELAEEISTYKARLPEWIEHEDRFVLIKDSEVNGFFDDYEQALRAGYQRYGLCPFLVKQVHQHPKPLMITRMIAPRRA